MNAISAWFASHKLSSHITAASILALFTTAYQLWENVPPFKAELLTIYNALPGWVEGILSCAVAVIFFYWNTRKPGTTVVTVDQPPVA